MTPRKQQSKLKKYRLISKTLSPAEIAVKNCIEDSFVFSEKAFISEHTNGI